MERTGVLTADNPHHPLQSAPVALIVTGRPVGWRASKEKGWVHVCHSLTPPPAPGTPLSVSVCACDARVSKVRKQCCACVHMRVRTCHQSLCTLPEPCRHCRTGPTSDARAMRTLPSRSLHRLAGVAQPCGCSRHPTLALCRRLHRWQSQGRQAQASHTRRCTGPQGKRPAWPRRATYCEPPGPAPAPLPRRLPPRHPA